jgi:ABC-type multidrug transport system, ATPase component
MGPSGAGKTTLLNCLSNRKQNTIKIESCNIFLNYNPINPTQYSSLIGFVPQDDILFTSMTPREILDFSAGMTLRISPENKKMLVDQTLKELGLNACADTVVGGLMTRGLSGGEKKGLQ